MGTDYLTDLDDMCQRYGDSRGVTTQQIIEHASEYPRLADEVMRVGRFRVLTADRAHSIGTAIKRLPGVTRTTDRSKTGRYYPTAPVTRGADATDDLGRVRSHEPRGNVGAADTLIGAIAPGEYRRGDRIIEGSIPRVAKTAPVARGAQHDQNGQLEPGDKRGDLDKDPYAEPTIAELGATERDRRTESEARRDLRRTLKHVDELEDTIRAYERYTAEPIRPIRPAVLRTGKRPAAAVALLSDIHAEESVLRTEAIANEYSLPIAERRVSRFFAGVTWLIKHAPAFDVDTLVLWLGGDLISGDIHDELLERCEVPPAEATLIVRDWLVAGFRSVLAALPDMRIVVPCSCGNHSRTTQKMRAATGYGHSWEWLLYQVLGHDFRGEPRIQFHATRDEMQYVDVHGFSLAFHHGHRMRYNGGIGGVTIPAVKACHRWEQWRQCDFFNFGHFHTRIDLGQIAFNGSVIGPSPYGFAIGAAPEPPQQSFYLLDDKRGKTMASPVWVAE